MTAKNGLRRFILERFRELYREIVAVKEAAAGDKWPPEQCHAHTAPAVDFKTADEVKTPAELVRNRLAGLLGRHSTEATRLAGQYGEPAYLEAQYAIAALADDILLHTEWPGRGDWQQFLLEFTLFDSKIAGERIFERIDDLISGHAYGQSVDRAGLAELYLLILSLGFQGKYRDGDLSEIERLKKKLFIIAFGREPKSPRRPCAKAYESTLTEGAGGELPHIGQWSRRLGAVVIAFLVVSHLAWLYFTHDIKVLLDQVM